MTCLTTREELISILLATPSMTSPHFSEWCEKLVPAIEKLKSLTEDPHWSHQGLFGLAEAEVIVAFSYLRLSQLLPQHSDRRDWEHLYGIAMIQVLGNSLDIILHILDSIQVNYREEPMTLTESLRRILGAIGASEAYQQNQVIMQMFYSVLVYFSPEKREAVIEEMVRISGQSRQHLEQIIAPIVDTILQKLSNKKG